MLHLCTQTPRWSSCRAAWASDHPCADCELFRAWLLRAGSGCMYTSGAQAASSLCVPVPRAPHRNEDVQNLKLGRATCSVFSHRNTATPQLCRGGSTFANHGAAAGVTVADGSSQASSATRCPTACCTCRGCCSPWVRRGSGTCCRCTSRSRAQAARCRAVEEEGWQVKEGAWSSGASWRAGPRLAAARVPRRGAGIARRGLVSWC